MMIQEKKKCVGGLEGKYFTGIKKGRVMSLVKKGRRKETKMKDWGVKGHMMRLR